MVVCYKTNSIYSGIAEEMSESFLANALIQSVSMFDVIREIPDPCFVCGKQANYDYREGKQYKKRICKSCAIKMISST